jgi:type VI secretion system secreted protein Hcp
MSTPAHLWLEDENGSPIVGSYLMPLTPHYTLKCWK